LQEKSISSIGAIVGIASMVSNLAMAQSQPLPPAVIADNDSIYIDGKDLFHHARSSERRHLGTDRSARGSRFGSRREYFSFGAEALHRRGPSTCAKHS